jgi:thiol-disulfide isomerase/thioredoxin
MSYAIKYFTLFVLLLSITTSAQPRNRTITGVVRSFDDSFPIEGVTVSIKGKQDVSGTQQDGIFYIQVLPEDSVLVFQHPDFQQTIIRIGNANEYNVLLQRASGWVQTYTGNWRAVFTQAEQTVVPVQLSFVQTGNGLELFFVNGEERFSAGIVDYVQDTLRAQLDLFEQSLLVFKDTDGQYQGLLKRNKGNTPAIRFSLSKSDERFSAIPDSTKQYQIASKYRLLFSNGVKTDTAVALFWQKGALLQASILRITGDARYLTGRVDGRKFRLSSFIGGSVTAYEGAFQEDGTLVGYSIGPRSKQLFTGIADPAASLPDAYGLTKLQLDREQLRFRFKNAIGTIISNDDQRFQGKPLIVTIGGTWCPNCMDEAGFLGKWYTQYQAKGIEVLGIMYERDTSTAYVQKAFTRFSNRFNITYPLVLGGLADKQEVVKTLPDLQTFLAFPTTFFIGKDGKVKAIHTGFSGPATGAAYTEWVSGFQEHVAQLLQ